MQERPKVRARLLTGSMTRMMEQLLMMGAVLCGLFAVLHLLRLS